MSTPMIRLRQWMLKHQSKFSIPEECLQQAEKLIIEEKEEIIKAREDGVYTMINGTVQDKQYTSEDYYNRVYVEQSENKK